MQRSLHYFEGHKWFARNYCTLCLTTALSLLVTLPGSQVSCTPLTAPFVSLVEFRFVFYLIISSIHLSMYALMDPVNRDMYIHRAYNDLLLFHLLRKSELVCKVLNPNRCKHCAMMNTIEPPERYATCAKTITIRHQEEWHVSGKLLLSIHVLS